MFQKKNITCIIFIISILLSIKFKIKNVGTLVGFRLINEETITQENLNTDDVKSKSNKISNQLVVTFKYSSHEKLQRILDRETE